MLRPALAVGDVDRARPAVTRWLKTTIGFQGAVLLGAGGYVVALASSHRSGVAWIAPALGAVTGTALPLQIAVVAILRAGRRG